MKKHFHFYLAIILLFSSLSCRETIVTPEEKDDPKHHVVSLKKILNPSLENDVWKKGEQYEIKCEVTEHLENVIIKLDRKDYEQYIISTKTPNDGSFEWIPGNIPPSHHYKIKLISYDNSLVYVESVEFQISETGISD
ncbi:MAG: hypothetical protein V3V16_09595 [Melioribacteraceae bacterium]